MSRLLKGAAAFQIDPPDPKKKSEIKINPNLVDTIAGTSLAENDKETTEETERFLVKILNGHCQKRKGTFDIVGNTKCEVEFFDVPSGMEINQDYVKSHKYIIGRMQNMITLYINKDNWFRINPNTSNEAEMVKTEIGGRPVTRDDIAERFLENRLFWDDLIQIARDYVQGKDSAPLNRIR